MTANRIRHADHIEHVTKPHLVDAIDPVAESDRLEQLTPVDPVDDPTAADSALAPTAHIWAGDPKATGPGGLVDEADWLEQQLPVPVAARDDEDYPPDPSDSQ